MAKPRRAANKRGGDGDNGLANPPGRRCYGCGGVGAGGVGAGGVGAGVEVSDVGAGVGAASFASSGAGVSAV
jgi:hypothetical protein